MAGPSWLVDGNRIATKIKSASGTCDPGGVNWKSDPTRACPNCQHIIDNSDVTQEWPGLPRGVKFDPSDQEIIWHLLAKVGAGNLKPHPFIDEFITTVDEADGICYTHPQNLPGVTKDGSASHFFHRAINANANGTRKRRKVQGDARWHKTGKTKPVMLDGVQRGCKKIMVLYVTPVRGGKPEKTYWVMHQYHLGIEEDEEEGEYIISKVSYQQQEVKQSDRVEQDDPESIDTIATKVDPVTPKSVTPEPPRTEKRHSDYDLGKDFTSTDPSAQHHGIGYVETELQAACEEPALQDHLMAENHGNQMVDDNENQAGHDPKWWDSESQHLLDSQQLVENENQAGDDPKWWDSESQYLLDSQQLVAENHGDQMVDNNENQAGHDPKWWDSESQHLLDSQQLVEGLSLCDELLQSQSPNRDGNGNEGESNGKPRLSDYVHLGSEDLKKDLEECQNLVLDPANIRDTPPEFRLSQLEFGSQESYLAWGGSKVVD